MSTDPLALGTAIMGAVNAVPNKSNDELVYQAIAGPIATAIDAGGGGGGGSTSQAGTVAFSGSSSQAVTITEITGAAYSIALAPSLDTGDGSIPAVAWASKTATGFVVKTSATFTGSVDWTVTPHT